MNTATEIMKRSVLDLTKSDWQDFFQSQGLPAFRASQVMQWLHQHLVDSFEDMANIGKSAQKLLSEHFFFPHIEVVSQQESQDGTIKWLIKTQVGAQSAIEMVYIPEPKRRTLCVSSQVGCELNCQFCHTATQGFDRNLSTSEILSQLWFVQKFLKKRAQSEGLLTATDPAAFAQYYGISNVVFMGMGEPLRNLDAVLASLKIMMDDFAYGLSKRRVTVSTSGVVPGIEKLGDEVDVALALSLHAPTNEIRDQIVPINKKYPLEELLPSVLNYLNRHDRQMHVTLEYVMLDGVNDQIEHAKKLSQLIGRYLSGRVKINLIPFNTYPTAKYRCSEPETIRQFAEILRAKNIITTIRKTRGPDILGACGQLAGDVLDKTRRRQKYLQELSQTQASSDSVRSSSS